MTRVQGWSNISSFPVHGHPSRNSKESIRSVVPPPQLLSLSCILAAHRMAFLCCASHCRKMYRNDLHTCELH